MASPENPRAASAAPTTRRAVLSKRVWQDLRRARALGDDGRGGSIALHGVQIYFAHKQQGIESQQAQHAQRQDDAARHIAKKTTSHPWRLDAQPHRAVEAPAGLKACFEPLFSTSSPALVEGPLRFAVNATPRQILRANGLAACTALFFWSALADGKA